MQSSELQVAIDIGSRCHRVAMEGFNGHARPLDSRIQVHGYRLLNVNNLKLARFKEILPGPAKSDPIDARKILERFELGKHLPLAKDALQEVAPTPLENQKLSRWSLIRYHGSSRNTVRAMIYGVKERYSSPKPRLFTTENHPYPLGHNACDWRGKQ